KEKPRTTFRTATVSRGAVMASVQATGTLEPEEVVDVGAQIPGIISELGPDPKAPGKTVDFQTQVQGGTILARINPDLYRLRVDLAKAGLERARASLQLLEVRVRQADRDWTRIQKVGQAAGAGERDAMRGKLDAARAELQVGKADVQLEEVHLNEAELNL